MYWWQSVPEYFWCSTSCPLFLLNGHCFLIQQCFSLSKNPVVGFSCQPSVIATAWMFKQTIVPVFFWEKIQDIRNSKQRNIQILLPLRGHSCFSTSSSIFSEEKVHYKQNQTPCWCNSYFSSLLASHKHYWTLCVHLCCVVFIVYM